MNEGVLLTCLTLAVTGIGVVLWFFMRKIMSLPEQYVTKPELQQVQDVWRRDLQQHREDRLRDHAENKAGTSQIAAGVAALNVRFDSFLALLLEKFKHQ